MPAPRSRRWVFTINNPLASGEDDPAHWLRQPEQQGKLTWAIWQYERGEAAGTLHVQGFVHLKQPLRLAGMKRLNGRASFRVANGDNDAQRDYCHKDEHLLRESDLAPGGLPGGVDQRGEMGAQPASGRGGRSDLLNVQRLIDSGATMREVAEAHFGSFIRYNRGFEKYRQLIAPQRNWQIFTTVYFGPPGCGKSRRALQEAGSDAYWLPRPNGLRAFWDGYDGQENVVVDEFNGWMMKTFMCRLLDRYPLNVETKGGSVPFRGKKLWITSNQPPEEWWRKSGLGPIARRLSSPLGVCYRMEADGTLQLHEPSPDPVPILERHDAVVNFNQQ